MIQKIGHLDDIFHHIVHCLPCHINAIFPQSLDNLLWTPLHLDQLVLDVTESFGVREVKAGDLGTRTYTRWED
jgi:hypothetical protein